MSEVRVVATKTHRAKDKHGRTLGHVGEVERRSPKKVALSVGKRFAAWRRLTVDGVVVGHPERFDTFSTEDAAVEYATRICKNSEAP